MVDLGEQFQLSRWFNASSSSSSVHSTDSEDGDAAGSADDDAATPSSSVNLTECFICQLPNPEYMSTNTVKKAPPVPVCSVGCEAKYLERKGMRPSSSDAKNAKPTSCSMCHAADSEYAVSCRGSLTPVCSKECEEKLLRHKKRRVDVDGDALGTRSSMENVAPAKRQRRTLNFLGDQLLGNSDGTGYKSWWLGALAFYDFVYQRHGMWHSYSISNDVPRVDKCLIKFGTYLVESSKREGVFLAI